MAVSKKPSPAREERDAKVEKAAELAGSDDLARTVEVIGEAAQALDEMLRYNQAMKSVASRGVAHYRAEAQEARRQLDGLAERIAAADDEKRKLAADYEKRIRALEARIAEQDRELHTLRSLLWPDGDAKRP